MVKHAQPSATFEHRKKTFLGKDDKSSAGGIDVHAREVCAVINERADCFTTSSCSGRAYLWRGEGVKSTAHFSRFRVTHELVPEAEPYFDVATLDGEVVDGAWEEQRHRTRERAPPSQQRRRLDGRAQAVGGLGMLGRAARWLCGGSAAADIGSEGGGGGGALSSKSAALSALPAPSPAERSAPELDPAVWLRFEAFILHVCCKDFASAANLIGAARQVFKNVGVQSWSEGKIMVAIWGDEGLEMPLTDPGGGPLFAGNSSWLQEQVNSRHRRNWAKIDRFTEACRALPVEAPPCPLLASALSPIQAAIGEDDDGGGGGQAAAPPSSSASAKPRHFDVIGDVALLATAPEGEVERSALAKAVLKENGRIKIVAARSGTLQGDARAAGRLDILAGPQRRPLITTHSEFGVKYVVDLETMFFSTRMGPERQRICGLVRPGEEVCVLFAGCCPEALQLADKTEAASIVAVELNAEAVRCARRSLALLAKRSPGRAARLRILEGDAREVAAASLAPAKFHRILAPRPKGKTEEEDDALASQFLLQLLPLLRGGGCCHWYDFVADWEFPACERSVSRISAACGKLGLRLDVLRCAPANNKPVAERQYRTVIDFAVS